MKKSMIAIGLAVLGTVASASAAAPAITDLTGAIDDAETAATTIGGAGLGLLGLFIVYKLVRRAGKSLV
jgi:uncharacterized membrane protein